MEEAGIIGVLLLGIIAVFVAPFVVAACLVSLFALPFWPCFWLAVGVALLTRG